MRVLCLIASCLGATLGIAQEKAQSARPTVLVVGEVQHGHFRAAASAREILIRSKPKPQADLRRAVILRAGGSFAVVPLDLRRALDPERRVGRPRFRPGDVLVVPSMPHIKFEKKAVADPTLPIAALRATLQRLPESAVATELAIRLFLLRHDPDAEAARQHTTRIGDMGFAAQRALPVLRDLANQGHPAVRPMAKAALGTLRIKVGDFCACDCFPGGTEVRTPRGPRAIESLRSGERVLDGAGRAKRVVKVHRARAVRLVELDLGSSVLRSTPGHRFLTRSRGWVTAAELRPCDVLTTGGVRDDRVKVRALESVKLPSPIAVYTLALAGESPGSFQVGTDQIITAAKTEVREPAGR